MKRIHAVRAVLGAPLLAGVAESGAWAQDATYTCRFETACFQLEPCAPDSEIGVLTRRGDIWQYDIKGAGYFELHAHGSADSDPLSLVGTNVPNSAALLSVFADGSARESIHFLYEGEPRSITRHGTCEASE